MSSEGTDDAGEVSDESDASDLVAGRCPDGHLAYPPMDACPECGRAAAETVDLSDREATVVTWTTSAATPTGVRAPNTIAIVEFDVDGTAVRAIGGVTDEDAVEVGDRVRPVHVEQLRDPSVAVRETDSQRWDGYRFEPVES